MPHGDDPDHQQASPVERWYVPVRPGPGSNDAWCVLRLFRTPLGEPTAAAFTDESLLTSVLGVGQQRVLLSEPALRELITPLGIERITLDPVFSAPAPEKDDVSRDRRESRPVPVLAGHHA